MQFKFYSSPAKIEKIVVSRVNEKNPGAHCDYNLFSPKIYFPKDVIKSHSQGTACSKT